MSSSDRPAIFPADAKSPKRMRLGTKSCVECRRRKVRCIIDRGSRECRACLLHDVPCRSQQSATHHEPDEPLRDRVLELEKFVKRAYSDTSEIPLSSQPHSTETKCQFARLTLHDEGVEELSATNSPLIHLLHNAQLVADVNDTIQDAAPRTARYGGPTVLDQEIARSIFNETNNTGPRGPCVTLARTTRSRSRKANSRGLSRTCCAQRLEKAREGRPFSKCNSG